MSLAGKSIVENASILQSLLEELVSGALSLQAQHEVNKKLNESNDVFSNSRKRGEEDLEEQYYEISHSHKELGLKFSALQSAVHVAQNSCVMSQLLNGLYKESDERNPFVEDLDPEEIDYVKELLDEQMELCKEVFDKQVQILNSELQLSKSRTDLLSSFTNMKEKHSQMFNNEEENETEEMQGHKVIKLQESLRLEEEKLQQIKYFVLNIINLIPSMGLDEASAVSSQQKKLILDCSKSLDDLRSEM